MPAFRSVGTMATAVSGNVTPALPLGWLPDDVFICFIRTSDNVAATMPAGWTLMYALNSSTTRATAFWRRAVTGDTAPLVTHAAGANIAALVAAYSGAITSGTPVDTPAGTTWPSANAAGPTCTTNDFTPSVANELILFVAHASNNTTSGYSGTNPTFTERFDPNPGGPKIAEADGISTSVSALGARTATFSASPVNHGALFGIKPAGHTGRARLLIGRSVSPSSGMYL